MKSNKSTIKSPTIIALGSTGAGKSTLLCELSKTKLFEIGHDLRACTREVNKQLCKIDGKDVNLIDTPGFLDNRPDENILKSIKDVLISLKDGFNLVLYLIPVVNTRLKLCEIEILEKTLNILGLETISYYLIVFTQAERLNDNEKEKAIKNYKDQTGSILSDYKIKLESNQFVIYERDSFVGLVLDKISEKEFIPIISKNLQQLFDQNIKDESALLILNHPGFRKVYEELLKGEKERIDELLKAKEENKITKRAMEELQTRIKNVENIRKNEMNADNLASKDFVDYSWTRGLGVAIGRDMDGLVEDNKFVQAALVGAVGCIATGGFFVGETLSNIVASPFKLGAKLFSFFNK